MDLRWLLFLRKSIEVADVNKREKLMMKEKKIKISIEEVLYIGFFFSDVVCKRNWTV